MIYWALYTAAWIGVTLMLVALPRGNIPLAMVGLIITLVASAVNIYLIKLGD